MKGNGTNIHELTRVEAYLLSEKAGHPSHMHDYFWAQAETIIRQRVAVVNITVKASGKTAVKIGKSVAAKATPATQKALESQLPLGDEPVTAKPTAAAPKSKPPAPAKKQAAVTSTKAKAKPTPKSK